jgi:toluene monooxygenase system ferredoxin subunit
MGFKKICTLDDVWEGEMAAFEMDDHEILIIHSEAGKIIATQAVCPHQDIPLVEGKLELGLVTCRAHLWQFDVDSGCSVNPEGCELARYPVRIDGDDVLIDVTGVTPKYANI